MFPYWICDWISFKLRYERVINNRYDQSRKQKRIFELFDQNISENVLFSIIFFHMIELNSWPLSLIIFLYFDKEALFLIIYRNVYNIHCPDHNSSSGSRSVSKRQYQQYRHFDRPIIDSLDINIGNSQLSLWWYAIQSVSQLSKREAHHHQCLWR